MDLSTVRQGGRRRAATLSLAAVLTIATAACGSDSVGSGASGASGASGGGNTTTVTVGVIPIIDVAPIYLGIDKGFFKAEGLSVKLQTAQGGAAIVPSVVSGQYQFGFSNNASLLLAESKNLKLKVVTPGVSTTGEQGADFGGVVVKKGSSIKSAKDLAGKKVAVNTLNNINTVTVNAAVEADGGDPSKIQYTELGFPDIAAAVAKGDVDAGQLVEPFLTIAKNQGDTVISSNYVDTDPDLTIASYFTSANYAKSNAATVTKFTTAMNKSLDYAQTHSSEVRAVLTKYTDIDAAVQKQVVLPKWSSAFSTSSVSKLATLMKQDGLLTSQPDLTSLLP